MIKLTEDHRAQVWCKGYKHISLLTPDYAPFKKSSLYTTLLPHSKTSHTTAPLVNKPPHLLATQATMVPTLSTQRVGQEAIVQFYYTAQSLHIIK